MTVLLERERELAEIDDAVAGARSGSGRLVVIEAEAGLGKTRLLHAAREAGVGAGLSVLTARATELERDFPFSLVRQLLVPRLASTPAAERDALFDGAEAARGALGMTPWEPEAQWVPDTFSVLHALYWVTASLAEPQPLLLAIDDAHWADAASQDYLGFLLPRLEELPVLLAVTARPVDPETAGGLARIVADPQGRRLTPRTLSTDATEALLAAELGGDPDAEFAKACHDSSGGNPFLLCELARTLAERQIPPRAENAARVRDLTPERVARTVLVRLARLPADARAVARALAVAGDDSDHRLVAALAGLDADAVLSAADTLRDGFVFDRAASLRFIHPLVHNAVYVDLRAGQRALAHKRAAALLRDRDADPEQIATHLLVTEARGDREAVETLVAAGRSALRNGAPKSAIAFLTRALREPPPPDSRAGVLGPLISAGLRAVDGSLYAEIESDVFAEMERNPRLRGRWALKLSLWMTLSGRLDEAVALLEQAVEVAAGEGDIDRVFRFEAQLTTVAQLPVEEARARLERYRDRVEPDSASGRLAAALDAQWAMVDGRASDAADLARRALRDGELFTEQTELMAPGAMVFVLIFTERLDDAQRGAEQALAVAREQGATPMLAGALWLRGFVAFVRGDLPAAEVDVRQSVDLAREAGIQPALLLFTGLLVEILIRRDQLDLAEAELDATGFGAGVMPEGPLFGLLLYSRGRVHLARGRTEQAVDDFLEYHRRGERTGVGAGALGAGPIMLSGAFAAVALVALGERERARELAEAWLVRARRWGVPITLARSAGALGLAVGGEAGIELLEEAVAVLEDSPARLERGHALCELGAALRRGNRRVKAREPLRRALEIARGCGATELARRAYDELQACGEKVPRYTPIGVESLTPSERRVAEMAASGLTNRQIAQLLFVTIKTVETHLSASYDKLGIRSRRQLSAALSRPSVA